MHYLEKIDSFGRIIIPEEIRNKYKIDSSDYLEFICGSSFIAIRKYSIISRYKSLAQNITDILEEYLGCEVFITDTNKIIAYSGEYKEKYLDKNISKYLLTAIRRREEILEKYEKDIEIIDNEYISSKYIDKTIIVNGEEVGLLFLYRDNFVDEVDLKIIDIALSFLIKTLEE